MSTDERSVTIADYLGGVTGTADPGDIWPYRCTACGMWCETLAELVDEDRHDWPTGNGVGGG